MKTTLNTKYFKETEELAFAIKGFLSDYSEREIDFIQYHSQEARMRRGSIKNTTINDIEVRATSHGFIEFLVHTESGYMNLQIKAEDLELIEFESNALIRFSYDAENQTDKYFAIFLK